MNQLIWLKCQECKNSGCFNQIKHGGHGKKINPWGMSLTHLCVKFIHLREHLYTFLCEFSCYSVLQHPSMHCSHLPTPPPGRWSVTQTDTTSQAELQRKLLPLSALELESPCTLHSPRTVKLAVSQPWSGRGKQPTSTRLLPHHAPAIPSSSLTIPRTSEPCACSLMGEASTIGFDAKCSTS